MQYGEAKVGDVVVDTDGSRWEVVSVVSGGHLRAVDADDASEHRFIRALNWPSYRSFTVEVRT